MEKHYTFKIKKTSLWVYSILLSIILSYQIGKVFGEAFYYYKNN